MMVARLAFSAAIIVVMVLVASGLQAGAPR